MSERPGNQQPSLQQPSDHRDLLRAITGLDAAAQQPVVNRTRRAVRIANDSRREQDRHGRRQIGITLLVFGAIVVFLAPAMWGGIDDFISGEHLTDLPAQFTLLSAFFMLAVVAALATFWRQRSGQDERHQDN